MKCFFLALLLVARADLPIHCLYQDVIGEWEFRAGPTVNGLKDILTCGHSVPNHAAVMAVIDPDKIIPMKVATYNVRLTDEISDTNHGLVAHMGDDVGYWTMVYDEGIEVMFPARNLEFFTHFSFSALNANESLSQGNWEHIGKYEGRVGDHAPPRGETFLCRCNVTSVGWYSFAHNQDTHKGCFVGTKKSPAAERILHKAEGAVTFLDEERLNKYGSVAANVMKKLEIPTKQKGGKNALIEKKQEPITKENPTFLHSKPSLNATMPKNFDWREQLEAVSSFGLDDLGEELDQGPCGSCYAFAATLAFQMRVRVALLRKYSIPAPVSLSWRAPTQCSPYTEGCDGGFSFLVYRHFKEVGAPLLSCDSSTELTPDALNQKCAKKCYDNDDELFYVKDYGYVGGFSQGSTEETIMQQIYTDGPVVVGIAVNAIPDFFNGKNGELIKKFRNKDMAKEPGHGDIPPWLWTTHAIVAIGWGETDEGDKYFIVRNSWGSDWGERGYTRIRRGKNDAGLELEAEWATLDIERSKAAIAKALESGFQYGKIWGKQQDEKRSHMHVVAPAEIEHHEVGLGFLTKRAHGEAVVLDA